MTLGKHSQMLEIPQVWVGALHCVAYATMKNLHEVGDVDS